MGLDMFAHSVAKNNAINDLTMTSDTDSPQDNVEIFYWRKHHDLHGWMKDLFHSKGGEGEFNLQPIRLTLDDLDKLEAAVLQNTLPFTTGMFFGNNPPDEESQTRDLAFIDKARSHIYVGREIYYNSWW
jgi:hypothetical protein